MSSQEWRVLQFLSLPVGMQWWGAAGHTCTRVHTNTHTLSKPTTCSSKQARCIARPKSMWTLQHYSYTWIAKNIIPIHAHESAAKTATSVLVSDSPTDVGTWLQGLAPIQPQESQRGEHWCCPIMSYSDWCRVGQSSKTTHGDLAETQCDDIWQCTMLANQVGASAH